MNTLRYSENTLHFGVARGSNTTAPSDGLLGDLNFRLELGAGGSKKTIAINSPGTARSFDFSDHGLSWSVGDIVPVKLRVIPANPNAWGKPTISGAARVDQSLTAAQGTIADPNGLTNATFSYQWIRVDGRNESDIPRVTGRTYRLTADDEGKRVKVKVSFTDDGGYSESRTSDAYPSSGSIAPSNNSPAKGNLLVSGTPKVGQVLTMDTSGITDANGFPAANRIYYGWMRLTHHTREYSRTVDIDMFTGKTYRLTQADVGSKIIATMWYRDLDRHYEVVDSEPYPAGGRNRTIGATSNSRATGRPTVTGTQGNYRYVGQPIHVLFNGVSDANGLPDPLVFPNDITYQWFRVDSANNATEIAGATNKGYVPTNDDHRKFVRVEVSFTDKHGFSETVTSDTYPPHNSASPFQGFHRASGLSRVGVAAITSGGVAKSFHTGSNPDGYELERTVIGVPHSSTATPDFDLWQGNPNRATHVASLQGSVASTGMQVFTPQGTHVLDPDTLYTVTMRRGAGTATIYVAYQGHGAGEGLPDGWRFAAGSYNRHGNNWIGRLEELSVGVVASAVGAGTSAQVTVDPPIVSGAPSVSDAGTDGEWGEGETVEVTVTFNEAVDVDTTGGTPTIGISLGGTEAKSASYVRGSGTTALVFSYTLVSGDGSHTLMTVTPDSLTLNGGTIQSQASDTDATLTHIGATEIGVPAQNNEPDAATARFDSVPSEHDGSTPIEFELHFSEEPESLSYTVVGGALLEVTGASVTGARRLTAQDNTSWEVSAQPSGNDDIVITLPNRACDAANAVCVNGVPLAAQVSVTIPGPAQETEPLPPFTAFFAGRVPIEHDGAASTWTARSPPGSPGSTSKARAHLQESWCRSAKATATTAWTRRSARTRARWRPR